MERSGWHLLVSGTVVYNPRGDIEVCRTNDFADIEVLDHSCVGCDILIVKCLHEWNFFFC